MELKAVQGKELEVRVTNRIGVVSDLAKILADKGIDLLSVHAYADGETGVVRIVTDDNLRAMDALKAQNYEPAERDAVLVHLPHKPGMLHRISECLSKDMIDIRHLSATADADADDCLVVVDTVNNDRAMVVLNEL